MRLRSAAARASFDHGESRFATKAAAPVYCRQSASVHRIEANLTAKCVAAASARYVRRQVELNISLLYRIATEARHRAHELEGHRVNEGE